MKFPTIFKQLETTLLVFISLMIILLLTWSINRGVLFSDESWYLMHWNKSFQTILFSHWYTYARLFFIGNLIHIRIEMITVMLLSALFLAGSINRIMNDKHNGTVFKYILIAVLGTFIFQSPVQFIPNYMTLNGILLTVCFGILALQLRQLSLKPIFPLAIGFLQAHICFIMPSNAIQLFMFQLLLYLILFKNHRNITILYFVGLLIGVASYFLLIDDFSSFYNDIKMHYINMQFDRYHGGNIMLIWLKETLAFLAKNIFIGYFAFIFLDRIRLQYGFLGYFILILFPLIDIYLTSQEYHNINSSSYIIGILSVLFFENLKNKKPFVTMLILVSLSFALIGSFGTNVPFYIRLSMYCAPLLLIAYTFSAVSNFKHLKSVLLGFIVITSITFIYRGFFKRGWQDYIISEQSFEVRNSGINKPIKLDQTRLNELKLIQKIIPKHSQVILSYQPFYGFAYMLDYNIPYLYFHFEIKQFKYFRRIKKINGLTYLMERKSLPFPNGIFTNSKVIDTLKVSAIPDLTIYKVYFN